MPEEIENQKTESSSAEQNSCPAGKNCKCKSNKTLICLLSILAVLGVGFGGFELWQNIENKNQQCTTVCDKKDVDKKTESIISDSSKFTVTNKPYAITDSEAGKAGDVKFSYGVYKDVLSTYSISYYVNSYGGIVSEIISNNIDLNTGEKIEKTNVLERFGTSTEEIYRKILGNLADGVSIDNFLLDTDGDVAAETISIDEFRNNIEKYVETLKGNYDLFYVFLQDSKVTVSFEQSQILKALGMSSHMGIGLAPGYVEIEL